MLSTLCPALEQAVGRQVAPTSPTELLVSASGPKEVANEAQMYQCPDYGAKMVVCPGAQDPAVCCGHKETPQPQVSIQDSLERPVCPSSQTIHCPLVLFKKNHNIFLCPLFKFLPAEKVPYSQLHKRMLVLLRSKKLSLRNEKTSAKTRKVTVVV